METSNTMTTYWKKLFLPWYSDCLVLSDRWISDVCLTVSDSNSEVTWKIRCKCPQLWGQQFSGSFVPRCLLGFHTSFSGHIIFGMFLLDFCYWFKPHGPQVISLALWKLCRLFHDKNRSRVSAYLESKYCKGNSWDGICILRKSANPQCFAKISFGT